MEGMDRNLVVRLAERYRLKITIRPDGSIVGRTEDLQRLAQAYAMADSFGSFKREHDEKPAEPAVTPRCVTPGCFETYPEITDAQRETLAKALAEAPSPEELDIERLQREAYISMGGV